METLIGGLVAIDDKKLDSGFDLFKALAHPLRLEILNFISKKKETNVQSIYNNLDIPQSVTSQQLKILKDANIVLFRRSSKERIYSINLPVILKVDAVLKTYFS